MARSVSQRRGRLAERGKMPGRRGPRGEDCGLIGRDGEPIRAVTFAGGGFATSLQLGVVHALLVSRGQAPDVVVGISAGAVNAVALAEILQAGDAGDAQELRLERRIERFREIFERYQSAPRELLSALLPDSFQIDTQRPLEPLQLPIHAERERGQRDRSIHSRSGLMNVYNELLVLGLPIGMIARATRRILGLRAIGEETDFARQVPTLIGEVLRLLDMVGANLRRLAPVVNLVLPAALLGSRNPPGAASAGELIFQARVPDAIWRLALHVASLAALVVLWLVATPLILAVLGVFSLYLPFSIAYRLAARAWRQGTSKLKLKARSGFEQVWSAPRRLVDRSGLARGWTALRRVHMRRMGRRLRRIVPDVDFLHRLRKLRPVLHRVGDFLGRWRKIALSPFRGLARTLRSLGNRRGFGWMKEPLRHIRKRGQERRTKDLRDAGGAEGQKVSAGGDREEGDGSEAVDRQEAGESAGEREKEAWAPPAPVLPSAAAIRVAMKLILTLTLRWLAWVVPVVLLSWLLGGAGSTVILAAVLLVGLAGVIAVFVRRRDLVLNFLRRNAIADGLLDPHPVRQLLVEVLDREYYGKLELDKVVESALADRPGAERDEPTPKRLSRYSAGDPPIRVGVAAANIESGELETLAEEKPVVDALLAAVAVVPAFSPQRIDDNVYVDGTNVANEPTRPLLKFLRERIPADQRQPCRGDLNPRASVVHMYTVSPLPISKPELSLERQTGGGGADGGGGRGVPGAHWPLVDVVRRALELQRFRDASLERRLTELYTRSMPVDGGIFLSAPPAHPGDIGKKYLRTWIYPIEPRAPISVNDRLLRAKSEQDRRRVIAETVADGCRAGLEAMIQPAIRRAAGQKVRCRAAMGERLAGTTRSAVLPGSDARHGPGLVEVCRHCALVRDDDGSSPRGQRCRLVPREDRETPPPWPLEGKKTGGTPDKRLKPPHNPHKDKALRVLKAYRGRKPLWPGSRHREEPAGAPPEANCSQPVPGSESTAEGSGEQRATVSLLFSGGVFRGVYQVGVLNALSEVGLRPDIVAGASVGSITAAMAARIFADGGSGSDKTRRHQIRRLAATYMAIDRLVLTDRFADFVRTMTVRAAQTRFSLRQIDRFVRQYDRALPGSFERQTRIVLAGLERLLYISPFEFAALLKALRMRRSDTVSALLREFFQELLDRGGVGDELLGSEPLELLISEHVLKSDGSAAAELRAIPFDHFLNNGIFLLATATNLTRGRLEILGEHQLGERGQRASLLQGLLASSAFPGVFRPRSAREVMPHGGSEELFTDGGVMDNLPLDAVSRFLMLAAEAGLIEARPRTPVGPVPHLVFSASLRADPRPLSAGQVAELEANWPRLRRRTKRLSYNQKLQVYETAQQAVRRIWGAAGSSTPGGFRPLDIEIVTVRPRWLCGTFAFHPMLGFRRLQQARSIAHGCASTLIRLDQYRRIETRERWAGSWGVKLDCLPDVDQDDRREPFERVTGQEDAEQEGHCWFRPGTPCPFSRRSLDKDGSKDLDSYTAFELDRIHTECGRLETHQPRP